jgi:hypothetical protein
MSQPEGPIPDGQQYPALPPVDYPVRAFYSAEFTLAEGMQKLNVATVRVPARQARSWRVTFSSPQTVEGNPLFGTTFGFGSEPMLGIVTWGTDLGVTFTAEVDWSRGRSFVVHGCSVNVDAQLAADHSTIIIGPGALQVRSFRIGCTIVPADDDGHSGLSPTRTIFTGLIAGGDSLVVRIPPYARRVRWYQVANNAGGSPTPPGKMRIDAADDPGFLHIRQTVNAGILTTAPPGYPGIGGAPELGLPIEATALWLAISNDGEMAETFSLNLEFDLDLG